MSKRSEMIDVPVGLAGLLAPPPKPKPKAKAAPKPRKAKPSSKPVGVLAPKPSGVFAQKGVPKPILKAKRPSARQQREARATHDLAVSTMNADNLKPSSDPGVSRAQARYVADRPKRFRSSDPLPKHLIQMGLLSDFGGHPIPSDTLRADSSNAAKVLAQTTRPLRAVAGAVDAAIQNQGRAQLGQKRISVPKAALRGLENKDDKTFSDVLRHVGLPNSVAAVGGFLGDWYLDPLSHLRIARLSPKAAAEARAAQHEATATRAATKARDAKTATGQKAREAQSARNTAKAGKLRTKAAGRSESRGVQVGLDIKVPFGPRITKMTSGRATAKAGEKLGGAGDKVHGSLPVQMAETAFNPTARKEGESIAERDARVYAQRKARAGSAEAERLGQRRASAYARNTHGVDEEQVIAAVEKAAKEPLTDTMRIRRKTGAHKAVVAAQRTVRSAQRSVAKERGRAEVLREQARRSGAVYQPPARLTKVIDNLATAKTNLASAQDAARGVPKYEPGLAEVAGRKVIQTKKGPKTVRVAGRSYEDFKATAPAHQISELPPKAQKVATAVEGELGGLKARQQAAGVLEGERPDYFPHALPPEPKGVSGVLRRRGRAAKSPYAKTRQDVRPIAEQHAERAAKDKGPLFDQNIPTVVGNYVKRSTAAIADSNYLQDLKAAGKPLSASTWVKRRPTDALYEITPTGIKAATKANGKDLAEEDVQKLIAQGSDVTILPRSVGDAEIAGRAGGRSATARKMIRVVHTPMRIFKTAATVLNVPYYQLRNFMDDSWRSWAGDATASSWNRAVRLVKDQSLLERRQTGQLAPKPISGDMMVAGRIVPRATVADWMVQDGIARTGFHAGEDLLSGGRGPAAGLGRIRPLRKIREYGQNLEDGPRVATWLAALDRGMTRAQAAAQVRIYHFDYDELTDVERAIRATLVPFYTYTKKNTSLMARLMVTRPGKLSAIEKLREEANKYGTHTDRYRQQVAKVLPLLEEARKQGLVSQGQIDALKRGHFESLLNDVDQRGVPTIGPDGKLYYMPIGITDLNRIPLATSFGMAKQLPRQQYDMMMELLGPQKLPIELMQNYSFFFRDAIFRDANHTEAEKWVSAPAWAKKAGIPTVKREVDGKPVDAWPAWLDYSIRALGPQMGMLANVGNPIKNQRGQTLKSMLVKQASGLRSADLDDRLLAGVQSKAIDQLGQIRLKIADAGDVPGQAGKADPSHPHFYSQAYQDLLDRQKALTDLLQTIKQTRYGLKPTKPTTLSRRPLSPEQQINDRIKKALQGTSDQAIKDRVDRTLEKLDLQTSSP